MTTQIRLTRPVNDTLSAPNGSYGNILDSGSWTVQHTEGAFVSGDFASDCVTIPENGLYLLDWSLILDNAASGIVGFTINKSSGVNGLDLVAIGGVVQVGASIGSAAQTYPLFDGDEVRLFAYGNGATLNVQDQTVSGSYYASRTVGVNITRIGDYTP